MHSVGALEIFFGGDKGPYNLFFSLYLEVSSLGGLYWYTFPILRRDVHRLGYLDCLR